MYPKYVLNVSCACAIVDVIAIVVENAVVAGDVLHTSEVFLVDGDLSPPVDCVHLSFYCVFCITLPRFTLLTITSSHQLL